MTGAKPIVLASILLGATTLVASTADPSGETSPWEWGGVPRIVAVGDVHGAYDKLVSILQGTGLADRDLAWRGGKAHLVLVGDLIDRGTAERPVLDLVRRLQQHAAAAGGRVHPLLGNHEVMNLTRDLRYVPPEGFAAFAADEREQDRRKAWDSFRKLAAQAGGGISRLRAAFDERYPPGYFGRMRAFAPDGEYGSWLLEQPAVVKVNGFLFVHGGLTQEVAALGLDEINRRVRQGVLDFSEHSRVLEDEVAGPADHEALHAAASTTVERRTRGARSPKRDAAESLLRLHDALPFSPDGPLWYRRLALENERIARVPLTTVLERLGARALAVAHSPTPSGRITSRFNDQLYRTDVGMGYGGPASALVIDGSGVRTFDPNTFLSLPPVMEPAQGEGWSCVMEELPDRQLERFLSRADVVSRERVVRGDRRVDLLVLERKATRLRAVFQFIEERSEGSNVAVAPRRYQHELAAYRLDRLLGLGMVPVTVPRTVEKQSGSVQIWMETAVDLPYLRTYGRWELLDGLDAQIVQAKVFTALIGNRDRHDAAKMLLPPERRVMIADNSRGFSGSTEVEEILTRTVEENLPDYSCRPLEAAAQHALSSLRKDELESEIGDYVSAAQIDTLLVRRDRILEFCAEED